MNMHFMCFTLVSLVLYVETVDLPSEFPKCKRSDPQINECLKNAIHTVLPLFEKGFPTFGIAPCNPVLVPGLTIGEGTGVVHVVQKFKDVEVYDILSAKIENLVANLLDNKFEIVGTAHFKEINMKANYNLNGRILVLPIFGEGRCSLKLVSPKVPINITGEPFQKKGATYINITNFDIEVIPKKVVYNFENLFNGDSKLGPQMNSILNDNDMDVYHDVKSSYEQAFGIIFRHIANSIFLKVPFDILLPP